MTATNLVNLQKLFEHLLKSQPSQYSSTVSESDTDIQKKNNQHKQYILYRYHQVNIVLLYQNPIPTYLHEQYLVMKIRLNRYHNQVDIGLLYQNPIPIYKLYHHQKSKKQKVVNLNPNLNLLNRNKNLNPNLNL